MPKEKDDTPSSEYVLARTPYFIDPEVVYGFIATILSPRFDKLVKSPAFHHELLDYCCKDVKKQAHAAPRDHSKSTIITLGFSLACALFRKKHNIMIIADTEDQSRQFLSVIKTELKENQDLIESFDIHGLVVDNEKELVCMAGTDRHLFRIFAKGTQQSLRGSMWRHKRPDLVIGDDMENDEMVENPQRRDKLKKWFLAALLPLMAKESHIRLVGTILHSDSLLEELLENKNWLSLRYEACDENFENVLWPEKYSADDLKAIYEDYKALGQQDIFAREYRNIPVDPSTALIKAIDLLPYKPDNKDHEIIEYILAGDLAISKEQTADETAFGIIGITLKKQLVLYDVIHERLDSGEIIDKLFELQVGYKPTIVLLEQENISRVLGSLLYDEMNKRNIYINLMLVPHNNKDLIKRSTPTRNMIKAHSWLFNKEDYWWEAAEQQLLQFPRGKRDDIVSMMALPGLKIMEIIEPNDPIYEEEEEIEELRLYGYQDEELFDDDYYYNEQHTGTGY